MGTEDFHHLLEQDSIRSIMQKLTSEANLNTLIAINVEGEEGVSNIDEFLRIDQLDIIFVGLFDLSKALGIPGEVDNPRVLSLLEDVTKNNRSRKVSRYNRNIKGKTEYVFRLWIKVPSVFSGL